MGAAAATAAHLLTLPSADARGLSVGLRVKQDFYQPLVPVSRSIQTCFKPDANGNPTLAICTEKPAPPHDAAPRTELAPPSPSPARLPAGEPSPKPLR